jgi:3-hydroxyacyl-CoA dehydrogenase
MQVLRQTFGRALSTAPNVHTVGVVGLGLMGHGIAQVAATAGYKVIGIEREQAALDMGRDRIESSVTRILSKSVAKGKTTDSLAQAEAERILKNLSYGTAHG